MASPLGTEAEVVRVSVPLTVGARERWQERAEGNRRSLAGELAFALEQSDALIVKLEGGWGPPVVEGPVGVAPVGPSGTGSVVHRAGAGGLCEHRVQKGSFCKAAGLVVS